MKLHPLTAAHWPAVRAIYEEGIATGNATFETQAPEWDAWDRAHLPHSRLVAVDEAGMVLGWAALSPVSSRCVYGGVAELSIYIAAEARGQGVGRQLLAAADTYARQHGCATIKITVLSARPELLAWYERHGYARTGAAEPFPATTAFGRPRQPLTLLELMKTVS